jgi:predicted Zn finger-like uncharacterized protein
MKFVCENCKAKYQIGDEKVAGKTLRMKCRRCGHMIQVSSSVTESSVARANPLLKEVTGELTGAELLLTGVHAAVSPPGQAPHGPAPGAPRELPDLMRSPADDDSQTIVRPSPLFMRTTGASLPATSALRPGASAPPPRAPTVPRIVPPARASVRPGGFGPAQPSRPGSMAPPSAGGTSNLAVGFSRAISTPPPAPVSGDTSQTEDWYVGVGGVPLGPVRLSVIKEKAAVGSVDENSLVWREGFDEWQPLKLFPVLLALVEDARRKPTPVPHSSARPSPEPRSPHASSVGITAPAAASIAATAPMGAHGGLGHTNGTNGVANGTASMLEKSPPAPLAAAPLVAVDSPALADPFRPSIAPVAVMSDPFAAPALGSAARTAPAVTASPADNGVGLGAVGSPFGPHESVAPPPPQKRGVHPIVWAFIAMCAAFGGVAAWAIFFKKPSGPQVVYQTTTVTAPGPGGTAPQPGTPNPNGAEPGHAGDVTPGDSGSPTTNSPNNPGGKSTGSGAWTSKSAKPDSTGGTADPVDPTGFDVGPGTGPKATSGSTSDSGKGQLSAGEIEGVVNRNKPTISRRCWDPAYDASDGKTKSAKVTANVTIGPSGAVTSVTASGGGNFPALAGCVQGSIAGWRFPPADGDSHTVIPFSFSKQ